MTGCTTRKEITKGGGGGKGEVEEWRGKGEEIHMYFI